MYRSRFDRKREGAVLVLAEEGGVVHALQYNHIGLWAQAEQLIEHKLNRGFAGSPARQREVTNLRLFCKQLLCQPRRMTIIYYVSVPNLEIFHFLGRSF